MFNRFRLETHALLLGGLIVAGCSVDNKGLAAGDAAATDVAAEGSSPGGTGGRAGTGGATGTGGAGLGAGSGGTTGSGGSVVAGTGGAVMGTGGSGQGTGGATGSGGSVGSGGDVGSGGSVGPGTGGHDGTGGDDGTGGGVGTGGAGTGGRTGTGGMAATGGRGTGGATAACNASNCANGCCNGNTCVTNRTDQRCGTAGATCAPCANCFQCSNAGVCGFISSAQWNIVCVSATITPTKTGGGLWDVTSLDTTMLPDPFCQLTVDGNRRAMTSTVNNTLSPMWNESIAPNSGTNITYNILTAQPSRWSLSVIDEDGAGTGLLNDPVCSISPRLTADDFVAGTVKLPATEACTSLVIQLVCADN